MVNKIDPSTTYLNTDDGQTEMTEDMRDLRDKNRNAPFCSSSLAKHWSLTALDKVHEYVANAGKQKTECRYADDSIKHGE